MNEMMEYTGHLFARMDKVLDVRNGLPKGGWRSDYVGLEGVLCIYQTKERDFTGARFFLFYQGHIDLITHLTTTAGTLEIKDGHGKLTTKNSIYLFTDIGEKFSEEEKEAMRQELFGPEAEWI